MKNLLWVLSIMTVGSALTHYGVDLYYYFLVLLKMIVSEAQNIEQNTSYKRGLGLMLPFMFAIKNDLCIMGSAKERNRNNN